jgi:hypothetical protein
MATTATEDLGFSEESVDDLLSAVEGLSDTEALSVMWAALGLLRGHVSSPQGRNCVTAAKVALLSIGRRFVPENVLLESIRRDMDRAPIADPVRLRLVSRDD